MSCARTFTGARCPRRRGPTRSRGGSLWAILRRGAIGGRCTTTSSRTPGRPGWGVSDHLRSDAGLGVAGAAALSRGGHLEAGQPPVWQVREGGCPALPGAGALLVDLERAQSLRLAAAAVLASPPGAVFGAG